MKSFAATGLAVVMSLLVAGCSTPATPAPDTASASATPSVTKPTAREGKEITAISGNEVTIAEDYQAVTGADDQGVQDAIRLGLNSLKVFTFDYAKYLTLDNALNQEELLALLPEVEDKMRPLMNEGTLKNFSEQWKTEASNPEELGNTALMLMTTGGDSTSWENPANLECGISNAEITVGFANPRLEAVPVEGMDYKVTAFSADAHYFIPCAEGKVMKQDISWKLTLGPSASGDKWELYQWERKIVGDATYVP